MIIKKMNKWIEKKREKYGKWICVSVEDAGEDDLKESVWKSEIPCLQRVVCPQSGSPNGPMMAYQTKTIPFGERVPKKRTSQ